MGKKDVLNILRRMRSFLEEDGIRVERIILFGSWAKGVPREGSDIDVVVISRDFQGKDLWARVGILSDAIYKIFLPVQAFALTPEEWEAKESVVCDFAVDGEVVPV